MSRTKLCAIAAGLMFLSGCVVGCGKEKEKPRTRAKPKKEEARKVTECERTVCAYLDALAASDYRRAVEFLDVEEMLEKGRESGATLPATMGAIEMKEALLRMMETSGQRQKGKLTYEILACHISGGEATVEAVVYRDGELADRGMYALARRGGEWKLRSSAVRALASPVKKRP